MAGNPVTLAGHEFSSQKAAVAYLKAMLERHTPGLLPRRIQGDDEAVLHAAIRRHPRAAEKIGHGIAHFEVRKNTQGTGTGIGFVVIHPDNSVTRFSYDKCVTGKERPAVHEFRNACRQAVVPFIMEVKNRFFAEATKPTCALTGVSITVDTSQVDHDGCGFDAILRGFVAMYGIDVNDPALVDTTGDRPVLADEMMKLRWVQYHNVHANLRVISADANQARARAQRNGNA